MSSATYGDGRNSPVMSYFQLAVLDRRQSPSAPIVNSMFDATPAIKLDTTLYVHMQVRFQAGWSMMSSLCTTECQVSSATKHQGT